MDTPLYQNDPRWKEQKIGLQNNLTIEQVGCMLTSFAMTVNHFGANETPDSLNEKMKASSGFAGASLRGSHHIALWACWSPYRLPDETVRWIAEKPRAYFVRLGHGPGLQVHL